MIKIEKSDDRVEVVLSDKHMEYKWRNILIYGPKHFDNIASEVHRETC